eukprot:4116578-Amphidinium_carterae.2
MSQALIRKLRSAGRAALGKGARKRRAAEVELTLAGSAANDPQVVADVGLIRTWDRWIQRGGFWPPSPAMWSSALLKRGGPLSALAEFAPRVGWHPGRPGGPPLVALCRGAGLDPVDLTQWRKLSNSATHAGRAACSAAAGGLWHTARIAE